MVTRPSISGARSRRAVLWSVVAAIAVTTALVLALAVAGRSADPRPPAAPTPSTSTSSSGPKQPIPVESELDEPGEAQFDPSPTVVPPTEPPATDIGGTPSPTVSPSGG